MTTSPTNSASTSPSIATLDFAFLPPELSTDETTPRGWSLQQPKPKHRTLSPITQLPPDGPKGMSLTAITAQEKPWYRIRNKKPKGWGRKADSNLVFYPGLKEKERVGVGKFDKDRVVCGVYAPSGRCLYTIGHEYAPQSRYRCKAISSTPTTNGNSNSNEKFVQEDGKELFWRTLGPSQTVIEMIEEGPGEGLKRLALFVYTSDPAQQMDPVTGRRKPLREHELGELWFTDPEKGWAKSLELVVLTCAVVLEMRKTRRV